MICGPWVSGRFVGCYDQSTESGHGWPSTSRPWMGGFVSNKISPLGGIPYMYQMFIIVYPCFIIFRTSHFFSKHVLDPSKSSENRTSVAAHGPRGCEGSMGWLWAFVETFVELALLIFLICVTSQKATTLWRDFH